MLTLRTYTKQTCFKNNEFLLSKYKTMTHKLPINISEIILKFNVHVKTNII